MSSLAVQIRQADVGIDKIGVVSHGWTERFDGFVELALVSARESEIKVGWPKVRFEFQGMLKTGGGIAVTLLTEERHSQLHVAVGRFWVQAQMLAHGLFSAGAVFLFVTQAPQQQPAFGV